MFLFLDIKITILSLVGDKYRRSVSWLGPIPIVWLVNAEDMKVMGFC